jgi:hypothetical protein
MASRKRETETKPFATGSRVLAKIHPNEWERGVFIAGHRFEPLRGPGLYPWELELVDAGGVTIPKRTVAFPCREAQVFFSLFGTATFALFMMEQDKKNENALLAPSDDAIVRFQAFDLAAFYAAHELSAGDYLELTLIDSGGKRFTARPVKAADLDEGRRKSWIAAMDGAVREAMRRLKSPVPPEALIREAFLATPRGLLEKPGASFAEYFNGNKTLEIRDIGAVSVMWERGADIPALFGKNSPRPRVRRDAFEKALADCGLSLDETEIAAFVKDALHAGKTPADGIERCFVGVRELGLPRADVERLYSLGQAFAEETARSYDPSLEKPYIAGRERPPSLKSYVITATIADIEPPIVRLLHVPGNRSLGELHDILQDAFGWHDAHLHRFEIKGTQYGEPSPEDMEPIVDEASVILDDLGLRGQSRFEYIYDYGDDWHHEIVVKMSRKARPDDPDRPVCLAASRSAPPEDCGGVPGYLGILEARATPARSRDEEAKQTVAWAKGWDPEACDLDEINEALAED